MRLLALGLGSAAARHLGETLTGRYGAGLAAVSGAVLLAGATVPVRGARRPARSVLVVVLAVRGGGVVGTVALDYRCVHRVRPEQIGDATTVVNIVQRTGSALAVLTVVSAVV